MGLAVSAYAEQHGGWSRVDGPRPKPSAYVRPRNEAELRELGDEQSWAAIPETIKQAELLHVAQLIVQRHREGRRYIAIVAVPAMVAIWMSADPGDGGLDVLWPAESGKAYLHFGDHAVAWSMKFLKQSDDALPLT
jgi:hypothetical protein